MAYPPLEIQTFPHKMMRAAGIDLLLCLYLSYSRFYEDLFHRYFQKDAKGVKIIYSGKAFASLPLVDGLRLFKTEIALKVPNTQPTCEPKLSDVAASSRKIDNGK